MDSKLQSIQQQKAAAGVELRPCVFLDRDGTVTEEAGYINHPARLNLISGAAESIRWLNEAGVLAVMVTNQAGVARGYFTVEVLDATLKRMKELLTKEGAQLDGLYYAVQHPSSQDPAMREDPQKMRKPGLGMIHQAVAELPIDLRRAYMVGDRYNDIVFAHKAGVKGILVQTGYGLGEYLYQSEQWTEKPDHIAEDLAAAVDWILSDLKLK